MNSAPVFRVKVRIPKSLVTGRIAPLASGPHAILVKTGLVDQRGDLAGELPLADLGRGVSGRLEDLGEGQMVDDVRLAIRTVADSDFYPIYPGNLPTPDELEEPIRNCLEGK